MMEKKENFKAFIRNNPSLIDYVNNGTKTWQQFYEMYDIYGENNSIWNKYMDVDNKSTTVGDTSLKDLFNMIKKVDLESVRKGAEGLQKAITLFQGLGTKIPANTYQARPMYQHFED